MDGYVQRIPDNDLRMILRGPESDVNLVINKINLKLSECQICVVRSEFIAKLPLHPWFRIEKKRNDVSDKNRNKQCLDTIPYR